MKQLISLIIFLSVMGRQAYTAVTSQNPLEAAITTIALSIAIGLYLHVIEEYML